MAELVAVGVGGVEESIAVRVESAVFADIVVWGVETFVSMMSTVLRVVFRGLGGVGGCAATYCCCGSRCRRLFLRRRRGRGCECAFWGLLLKDWVVG